MSSRQSPPSKRPPTAIVGAGRLATVFATALSHRGYPVVAVVSRTIASARRLARLVPSAAAGNDLSAVEPARLVLLAVPDGTLAAVARELAGQLECGWSRRTALHHAGSLGPEVLAPLARRGAGTGVLHPMQALGAAATATDVLAGSSARVEGDRRGRAAARRLALDLGLRVLPVKEDLRPADRMAYHAAASLVSNDVVALLSLAAEILGSIGVPPHRALDALVQLARGTLSQAEHGGIEAALTGPVSRGDETTTAAQLRSLRRRSRAAAEAHRLLSLRLLRLVEEASGLDPERRRALRRILRGES